MYKTRIFHPFLLGIFPIIYLYSDTIQEVPPQQMVLPVILMLTVIIALVIAIKFVFKDWKKSALIVSLILTLFILYTPVFAYLSGASIGDVEIGRHRFLIIPFFILLITISYVIFKTKRKLDNTTIILNTIAVSLIMISIINIATYNLEQNFYENNKDIEILLDKTSKPDIYFILIDAYSGNKVLEKYYDFDNQNFVNDLRGKGFFVHNESYSNYGATIPSLGSTFNMEYIDVDFERDRIYEMFPKSKVIKILKSNGYKMIDFQKHDVAFDIPAVDLTLCKKESNRYTDTRLMDELIKYTPLNVLTVVVPTMQDVDSQLCLFAELPNTKNIFKEPTFVFAHSFSVHVPYFYDSNGEVRSPSFDPIHYVDAIKFTNKKINKIVDELLDAKDPPIIIIIGDHGSPISDDNRTDEEKAIQTNQNLYAIYLPGEDYSLVEKTVTAVNMFRIIFNQFFNMNYELLEDRTFTNLHGDDLEETTNMTIKPRMD